MILGLVCARAGSKGVPGKNIRLMHGRPLMEYAVETARECPLIDTVAVATDLDVPYGDVQIPRPDYLNTDTASKWDVWRHCAKVYEEMRHEHIDVVVDIDVTRPLVTVGDVTACIERFRNAQADAVVAIAPARKSPYQDILEYDVEVLRTSKVTPNGPVYCRQQAPPTFDHGGVTVLSRHYLDYGEHLFSGIVRGQLIHRDHAYDIDTEVDWRFVEMLIG